MSVSYPIRPVDDPEMLAFAQVGLQAFNSTWPPEELVELDRMVWEGERTLAAFDDDRMVGTALAYSFGMTVPGGGVVDTAGVSSVCVLPTHRRRGILSALMRRQLSDVAAGGEPVAALFASEAVIYGRYGYGAASEQLAFTLHRGEGTLRVPQERAPTLRLAEPGSAIGALRQVYEQVRPTRPGMLTRTDGRWQLHTSDPDFLRDGSGPLRCVIAEDEAGPRGFMMYTARPGWGSDGMGSTSVHVYELLWADTAACAALWADILSRDLVTEVTTRLRPADDPLLYLLADRRRARARVSDGLWIRILDLPAALSRRRYAAEVDVVLEVTDPLLAGNDGRWRLRAGGLSDAKPVCERTAAPPDLALAVSALGAAYLGGTRLSALAAAGQVTEIRPGALAELSAAMWWDPAPWSAFMF